MHLRLHSGDCRPRAYGGAAMRYRFRLFRLGWKFLLMGEADWASNHFFGAVTGRLIPLYRAGEE